MASREYEEMYVKSTLEILKGLHFVSIHITEDELNQLNEAIIKLTNKVARSCVPDWKVKEENEG